MHWCMQHVLESGQTPLGHHQKWKAEVRLSPDDPSLLMHESLCKIWQTMCCYDQLDASNLACAELLTRQLQLIEDKHLDRLDSSSSAGRATGPYQDTHLYLGTTSTRGGVIVCPKLQKWIGEQLAAESLVLKERRKAREERALSRPNPKKGAKSDES